MVAAQIKEEIVEKLDQVDETTLKAVNAFLTTYIVERRTDALAQEEGVILPGDGIIGYEIDGTPIDADEFIKEADEIMAETHDRNDFITWLDSTK